MPGWLPQEVSWQVSTTASRLVGEGGGMTGLGAEQVVVTVGLGEVWQLTPSVAGLVPDEFGEGHVLAVRAEMAQDVVRSWNPEQQFTGLLAVAAGCVSAVLPEEHGARPGLRDAVASGAGPLPVTD